MYEIVYRISYIILTYLAIQVCYYFTVGFQYEYILAFWLSDFESIDFSFLNDANFHFVSNISDENPALNNINSYVTKIWSYVFYSNACILYSTNLNPNLRIQLIKIQILFPIIIYHWCAFIFPGTDNNFRLKALSICYYSIIIFILCQSLMDAIIILGSELFIEPLDSELITS